MQQDTWRPLAEPLLHSTGIVPYKPLALEGPSTTIVTRVQQHRANLSFAHSQALDCVVNLRLSLCELPTQCAASLDTPALL